MKRLTMPLQLRNDAEAKLASLSADEATPISPARILHELQVHQIELEMQNEALRQSQVDLEASRDRYVSLYEFAPVGYLTLRPTGIIVQMNLTAAALMGSERGKLIGRRFASGVIPKDRDRWHLHMALVMRSRDTRSCELSLQQGQEAVRHVQADCLRMAGDDGCDVIRVALIDVTERRRADGELSALRVELQQILQWQVARHTVAALAHEINQPLSSISALSEAGRRMLATDTSVPSERLGQTLQRMAIESERAGSVVRRLLESLHMPDVPMEPRSLAPLFHEVARVAHVSGFADFQILIDCAPDLGRVQINHIQVEKALLNLICNSAEAMRHDRKPGGRIWISASSGASGVEAVATVRDEGPGISTSMEQKMFHPFVTSKPTGMGMGLAISRDLIEAQGGKLWFDATEGSGATFHFTLPYAR